MQTSIFQSTLHAKPYTLEKSWTFKDKCVVSAEIFICNLLTGPLIKMIFKGQVPMLKEGLVFVSFCETVPVIFIKKIVLPFNLGTVL